MDIMLHKGVQGFPAETFGEFFGAHSFVQKLEVVKDSLKRQTNAFGVVVSFRWHLVNTLSENVGKVENLKRIPF